MIVVTYKGLLCRKHCDMAKSSNVPLMKLKLEIHKNAITYMVACQFNGCKTITKCLNQLCNHHYKFTRDLNEGDLDKEEAQHFRKLLKKHKEVLDNLNSKNKYSALSYCVWYYKTLICRECRKKPGISVELLPKNRIILNKISKF